MGFSSRVYYDGATLSWPTISTSDAVRSEQVLGRRDDGTRGGRVGDQPAGSGRAHLLETPGDLKGEFTRRRVFPVRCLR